MEMKEDSRKRWRVIDFIWLNIKMHKWVSQSKKMEKNEKIFSERKQRIEEVKKGRKEGRQ